MKDFLRDIFIVARYELADSIRSKRAVVVLVLYIASAILACNEFIDVIKKIENQLAETLQITASSSVGAVTETLWKSGPFRRMMISLVGDRELARELLSMPPIALLYGWLAFAFTPVLVMLTASGRIAEEISSGSVRFVIFRTSRASWCIGKFLGQSLTVIVALVLSAIGAWCVARLRLSVMDEIAVARAMILYAGKAWVYSLSFIGLTLGISQTTRSANLATAIGFMAWIAMGFVFWMSRIHGGDGILSGVLDTVNLLIPYGHRFDLWRLKTSCVVSAGIFLAALGAVYMSLGYALFRKKNL